MGWAGPAQPTGLDSAQKCWADFGSKMVGPISTQKKTNIPFWARPGPEGRAGPGSAWPSNQNGRGELFSPHPCMQNAIRSACREEKINTRMRGKKSYLVRGGGGLLRFWRCCGGGRWRCLGSRTAAPSGVAATFFLLPAVSALLLLFVSFAPSVNNVLLSLWWHHGGAGAAGGWWRCLGSRTAAPSSGSGATFSVFSHDPPSLFSSSFQLFLPLTVFRSLFLSFGFFVLSSLLLCFFVSSLPFPPFGSFSSPPSLLSPGAFLSVLGFYL